MIPPILLSIPKDINLKCIIEFNGIKFEAFLHDAELKELEVKRPLPTYIGHLQEFFLECKFRILGLFQDDEFYGSFIDHAYYASKLPIISPELLRPYKEEDDPQPSIVINPDITVPNATTLPKSEWIGHFPDIKPET